MTSRADDYRRRGKEAEDEAETVTDPVVRTTLLEIARRWRELAEFAERNWQTVGERTGWANQYATYKRNLLSSAH